MAQAGVYAFVDNQATFTGPGGSIDLASGGVADEGFRIVKAPKNTMTIGAGGDGMHSLHANESAQLTVTLLKTGDANAKLNQMYNYQQGSSAFWGQNIFEFYNPVTGDSVKATSVAFQKHTDLAYATEGGFNVWTLDAVFASVILGNGFQQTGVL